MAIKNKNKRDTLYSYQKTLIKEREDGNIFDEMTSILKIGELLNTKENIYENILFYNLIFKNRLPIYDFTCMSSTACCTTFTVNISMYDIYEIYKNTNKEYTEFCQVYKELYEDYINSKLSKENIVNNKYICLAEMQYQDNSSICIFLKNSMCSIHSFKPLTCSNFPFTSTTNMSKINFLHKEFLELKCFYILKDTNKDISNIIKNISYNSYFFKLDAYNILSFYKKVKNQKKKWSQKEIIEFFVSKFLEIQELEKDFLSKIIKEDISYITTSYDLKNEFKIFEIVSNKDILALIKENLKDFKLRKYKDKLYFKFNEIKIKIIFSDKIYDNSAKYILYEKEEYKYFTEKNILDDISIDIAYKVSDNLFNLISFSIQDKDINNFNQYINDFKLLMNKFEDRRISIKFIKAIKRAYFNSSFIDINYLKKQIDNHIEKFKDEDYYIYILKIHIVFIQNKNKGILINEFNILLNKFKDKKLNIYKYIINNKLDFFPINKQVYNNLISLLESNIPSKNIFDIIDLLNKENLDINSLDILFYKINYYIATNNHIEIDKLIRNINLSFENIIRIADLYICNNLLEDAFIYIQEYLNIDEDKNFIYGLSLNLLIDLYQSNKEISLFYSILDELNKSNFNSFIEKQFNNNLLVNYINYKISKNIDLLKNLKIKYFNFDKKTSFYEIIKVISENALYDYISSNNIEYKYIFIKSEDNYLNSLTEISKGNFSFSNIKLDKLVELYNYEDYKLVDDFVSKI